MNTHSVAESAKSLANGASRELRAVNHRVAEGSKEFAHLVSEQGKELAHVVSEQGAVLLQQASKGLQTAGRSARQHPWIASAAVLAGLAAVGGYLFSRRVRQQQIAPTRTRKRAASAD